MEVTIPLSPKSGELRPQHNAANSSATRTNVLEYDPDDYTLVNIRADTVQYGTFDGEPAALIVLRFIVKFRPGNKRLRSFHVTIQFRPPTVAAAASGTMPAPAPTSTPWPRVIALAPEERRGKLFTEERSVTGGGVLNLQVPAGPNGATVGPGVGGQRANKGSREYEMRLSGWIKSGEGPAGGAAATDSVAVWDCVEAARACRGVLPGYRAALVVAYPRAPPGPVVSRAAANPRGGATANPAPAAAAANPSPAAGPGSAGTAFEAVFTLRAERGLWNSDAKVFEWLELFGGKDKSKAKEDDPLLFDPQKPVGTTVVPGGEFKGVRLDDLITLEPIATLPEGYS